MTTTYYQTIATIIPVLLVAGMLNPELLREYSKTKFGSVWIQIVVAYSIFGMLMALIGTIPEIFTESESKTSMAGIVSLILSYIPLSALSFTAMFVFQLARFSLEKNPDPIRLHAEKRDLERKLRSLNSRIEQSENNGTEPSSS